MSFKIRVLLLFALAVVLVPPSFGQERKGAISGLVTDSSSSVLQGAQIEVQPKGGAAVTGEQGLFFINDLDPGTYTVSVNYVGFATFTKTVEVVSGQVAHVDAVLSVA